MIAVIPVLLTLFLLGVLIWGFFNIKTIKKWIDRRFGRTGVNNDAESLAGLLGPKIRGDGGSRGPAAPTNNSGSGSQHHPRPLILSSMTFTATGMDHTTDGAKFQRAMATKGTPNTESTGSPSLAQLPPQISPTPASITSLPVPPDPVTAYTTPGPSETLDPSAIDPARRSPKLYTAGSPEPDLNSPPPKPSVANQERHQVQQGRTWGFHKSARFVPR